MDRARECRLGEKPKTPTLGRFLVERVKPWAAKKKATTATWYLSGIGPARRLQADRESRPGRDHQ